jgi:DNA repair exonuclease SbcCD ATPase subunit
MIYTCLLGDKMEKIVPFYVEEFAIEEFYSVEYIPVRTKVNKQSLFVLGTNSTGKSTTFDAIIYAIFGNDFIDRPIKIANTKIILSNGEMSIEITRKYNTEPKILISTSDEEIKGTEQVTQKICELLNLPEKSSDAKRLIDALKVPQKDEDSLIMKYKTKLESVVLSFLNISDLNEKIELLERREKELNNQLELLKVKKGEIRLDIDDLNLKERKNKNFFAEVREFIEQFESGEIKKTIKALSDNEEIGNRAKKLVSLKTKKSQELFENGSKISRMREFYNKEFLEVLKGTISVLICPVCGDKVNLPKIESRKSRSMCPFCGNEDYNGEIYQVLKKEISYASENFERLLRKEEELKKDIEVIMFEIDKINSEKLKVNLNSVILRVLENSTEEEIEYKYRKLKQDLEKYEYSINDSKNYIEELKNKLNEVEKSIELIPKEIDDLLTLKRRTTDEKNSTILNNFNDKLTIIFSKLIYPLQYKLSLESGHLLLDTGSSIKDCSDKYAIALSDKKLIDIALWHSILITNHENNIININFGLIDDIFENIDNNEITRKENLYSVLNSLKMQSQIIVFSINKKVNENLQFEEKKLQIQTKINNW